MATVEVEVTEGSGAAIAVEETLDGRLVQLVKDDAVIERLDKLVSLTERLLRATALVACALDKGLDFDRLTRE